MISLKKLLKKVNQIKNISMVINKITRIETLIKIKNLNKLKKEIIHIITQPRLMSLNLKKINIELEVKKFIIREI
jgi:CO dehydrogenase nickel-insertion accessory protein CooC1